MGRKELAFIGITIAFFFGFRPALPVWTGAGLILLALGVGRIDLRSPSPKRRWAAFKRMIVVAAMGLLMVCGGLVIENAPWDMAMNLSEEAARAMFALFVYATSIIGTPVLAWAYVSHRERASSKKARSAVLCRTLSSMADRGGSRKLRTAV